MRRLVLTVMLAAGIAPNGMCLTLTSKGPGAPSTFDGIGTSGTRKSYAFGERPKPRSADSSEPVAFGLVAGGLFLMGMLCRRL